MKFTQILTLVCALATTGLWSPHAQSQGQATNKGDDLILEMHQAFRKGDKNRLSALLPQTRGHVLAVSYTHLTLPTNREV